jgi:hypothetical protein
MFYLGSMSRNEHSCTYWLRPRNPPPPPIPRIWTRKRGRYWSAKIDDISFVTPCSCSIPNYEPVVVDKVVRDGVDVDEARHQAAGQFAAHPAYWQFLTHYNNSPRDSTLIVRDCTRTLIQWWFSTEQNCLLISLFHASKDMGLILCIKDQLLLCREFLGGGTGANTFLLSGGRFVSYFFAANM